MPQVVTITVDDDANITIETSGFTGNDCEKATKGLRQALGGETRSERKKPEFFQANPTGGAVVTRTKKQVVTK